MEEILFTPIEWQAPEYTHKERSADWFWTIGLVALVGALLAIWFHNFVFAIFILISGACLIMFTLRPPEIVTFVVKTESLMIGKDEYLWKKIKGFTIKSGSPYGKLIVLTSKKFLPVYTIPFPPTLADQLRDALPKVTEALDLQESQSMAFAERIGF